MSSKQKKRFDRIAQDCLEANIPFPEQLVDRFERVAKKLNEDWGRPPAAEYLHDLIFPSRPGRQGFPPEVAEEILALKNLHEERYTNLFQTVWDPFDQMYRDKSGESEKKKEADQEYTPPPQQNKPSIYKTRSQVTEVPAEEQRYSAMVAQLLPDSVRKNLTRVKIAKAQSGMAVTLPAPESELEELLLDAETMLEEEHFNSGTAILEQITTLFPDESPFAYLRLMEIYQLIERPEDFEWVRQRLAEQFDCPQLEWTTQRQKFRAELDKLAEAFLIAMRRD